MNPFKITVFSFYIVFYYGVFKLRMYLIGDIVKQSKVHPCIVKKPPFITTITQSLPYQPNYTIIMLAMVFYVLNP